MRDDVIKPSKVVEDIERQNSRTAFSQPRFSSAMMSVTNERESELPSQVEFDLP